MCVGVDDVVIPVTSKGRSHGVTSEEIWEKVVNSRAREYYFMLLYPRG